jgi:hypothetical protein
MTQLFSNLVTKHGFLFVMHNPFHSSGRLDPPPLPPPIFSRTNNVTHCHASCKGRIKIGRAGLIRKLFGDIVIQHVFAFPCSDNVAYGHASLQRASKSIPPSLLVVGYEYKPVTSRWAEKGRIRGSGKCDVNKKNKLAHHRHGHEIS